jgi:anti-sigma factor RsiW
MGSPADKGDLMTAYLDDELAADEAAEFEAFLESSAEARDEMAQLRQMLQVVGQLGEVAAPPDFCEQVARKVRRRRILAGDGLILSLVSLPVQVLSIIVILAIAVTYMLVQLDRDRARIEKDPDAGQLEAPAEPTEAPPRPGPDPE